MRSKLLHSLTQLCLLTFLIGSCIKPEKFPIEPVITDIRMNNTVFYGAPFGIADSISMYIEFTDGDGDLGATENDTATAIFMVENRLGLEYSYAIPAITPQGSEKGIFGELEVIIATINCVPIDGGTPSPEAEYPDEDTVVYSVRLKDRAGNWSEAVESPPIVIRCNEYE